MMMIISRARKYPCCNSMLNALECTQSSSWLFLSLMVRGIIFVTYGVCWVRLCCRNPPNSDMDYRILIVRTDVNAYNCKRGVYGHRKRACPDSWLWEENPLRHQGIEPASAAWRFAALTSWAASHPHLLRLCVVVTCLDTIMHKLLLVTSLYQGCVMCAINFSRGFFPQGYCLVRCFKLCMVTSIELHMHT